MHGESSLQHPQCTCLDTKVRYEEQKDTLGELVDLHVSPECVIVSNCSEYDMMSYTAL